MTPAEPAHRSTGRRAVGGIGWSFVSVIGEQLSTLVAFIVLARLLGPLQFGTVILAVALVDIAVVFVRTGIAESLIRTPDLGRMSIGTGFWLNLTVGLMLTGALYFAAPAFGAAVSTPDVVPLLQAMTIVFPIAAISAIAESLLSRNLAFAAIAKRQIVASAIGAAAAIGLALLGAGPWAMIAQRITIYLVGCVLTVTMAKLVPPLAFSFREAARLLHFAGGITSINLLYRLQPRIAEVVVGFLSTPVAVGLYRAAYRLVDLMNQLPMQPLLRVTYPTLSKLQGTPDRFQSSLMSFMTGLGLMLLPAYVFVGFFAPQIVHLVLGPKWDAAAPVFMLLIAAACLRLPFTLLGPAASARGAVKPAALFSLIDVVVGVGLMALAAPFGIEAIAGSRLAGAVVLLPTALFLLVRPAGAHPGAIVRAFGPAAGVAAVLLAGLIGIDLGLRAAGIELNLLTGIAAGAVLYLVALFAFARSHLQQLLQLIDNRLTRRVLGTGQRIGLFPA